MPYTILVGRVIEIGERHLLLAPGTRIVLPLAQGPSGLAMGSSVPVRVVCPPRHGAGELAVGSNVTVKAVRLQGEYIAESITVETR